MAADLKPSISAWLVQGPLEEQELIIMGSVSVCRKTHVLLPSASVFV